MLIASITAAVLVLGILVALGLGRMSGD